MSLLGQKLVWKDTTPYAQGHPKVQRHWSTKISAFNVTIIKSREQPGRWLLYCRNLGTEKVLPAAIHEDDVASAKHWAVQELLTFAEGIKKACEES